MCKYGIVPMDARALTRGPVMVGKKRPPNRSHFTNKQGDEEFSQWIKPRTIPATQGAAPAESWAVHCTEKWFQPLKRTMEIQPSAENKATRSWFRQVLAHHQTSHFLGGFMGEPRGQPKCSANSRELETVPMTRKREGLWGSVISPSCELSGVRTEHHTCRQRARGTSASIHNHRVLLGAESDLPACAMGTNTA